MWTFLIFTFALQYAVQRAVSTTPPGDDRPSRARKRAYLAMLTCVFGFLAFDVTQLPETHYRCIGVDRVDAPKSALRAAFRKVSLEKHPDKAGKTPEAEAEFVRIRACYDTLADDATRKVYDLFGPELAQHPAQADELRSNVILVVLRHGLMYMVLGVLFYAGTISKERSAARPWCLATLFAGFVAELAMCHGGWDPLSGSLLARLPVHQQTDLFGKLATYACHCYVAVSQLTFVDTEALARDLLAEINKNQVELLRFLASEPWSNAAARAPSVKAVDADGIALPPKPPNWAQAQKLQQKRAEAEKAKEAGKIPWGTIIFVGIMALNWFGSSK
eukprot:TRINITY_DN16652_c0_g1_i1.p1 TRINITY_DN16652_c0_g1~~TRINITY_DN16652_c0_g1_i1.p1  ORF type:complete len:333 (-),score=145.89 TRINITY_DN16652_c0_g1_i1:37-1035(-)